MENGKLELVSTPDEKSRDPLTELLRSGAKALISKAVELALDTPAGKLSRFEINKRL